MGFMKKYVSTIDLNVCKKKLDKKYCLTAGRAIQI